MFVLGVHRSGTTWLSQLLTHRGRCAPFSVRHLLSAVDGMAHSPQSAAERLQRAGVTVRPGDGLPVLTEQSEEYGYLLALHHGSSRTTRTSLPTLRAAIDRLHGEHPHHTPILRNPWDYAATHRLAAWLPDARFVFVHRDPVATVGSAVEMFRDFWQQPHPYGELMSPRYVAAWTSWWKRPLFRAAASRPALVARIVASGTALAHRAHLADTARLPAHRCLHVRYPDHLANPTEEVDRLCDALGIPITGPPPGPARPRAPAHRPWLRPIESQIRRKCRRYRTQRALSLPPE